MSLNKFADSEVGSRDPVYNNPVQLSQSQLGY